MWPCQYCKHENDEAAAVFESCGSFGVDNIGDSGDNQDS